MRTITGVATSITAFIGRTAMGGHEPTMVNSFDDFEREYGRLDDTFPMSCAVRDFFVNDGTSAIIVRLYKESSEEVNDTARITLSGLELVAASRGSWGNGLRVRVDHDVSTEAAALYGLDVSDLFNLTVYSGNGQLETFRNVTIKHSPRRVDQVLQTASTLLRVAHTMPPAATVPTRHSDPEPGKSIWSDDAASTPVVAAGLASDGDPLDVATYLGTEEDKTGLFALNKVDLFNLLSIPPDTREGDTSPAVYSAALDLCVQRRAMLIIDPPMAWKSWDDVDTDVDEIGTAVGVPGQQARNAALYFPRLQQTDVTQGGQVKTFAPSGAIAGVMARTDAKRGVWKAPAGLNATIKGELGLSVKLSDAQQRLFNPLGVNCLRAFPTHGNVVWGARTMAGADTLSSEYKYVPVRRLALYIEESLERGLRWVASEPTSEELWVQIRAAVDAFMHSLFRQGAFQGGTPRDAYFVKCDRETTTQDDIDRGVVPLFVGFAPLKPAELVVVRLELMAGKNPG